MTRVLVTQDERLPVHRLRVESRRAGVSLSFFVAENGAEVERALRVHAPDIVLSTLDGLADLPAQELAEAAQAAGSAVVFVGGDTAEQRHTLAGLRGLFDGACRLSALSTLPAVLSRAARAHQQARERSTEQRRSSEQLEHAAQQVRELQRLATIGQLAGSIAHEINNPLEAVTNLVYLMSSDAGLPEHMRTYVELAQRELGRAAQISKQTLSFYRESQTPVRVLLSSLLDEVLVLFQRRLNEKSLAVDCRFEAEDAVTVLPGEVRQVFANLLSNAMEATEPHGRICIRLRRVASTHALNGAPRGAAMRVTIADSGQGIPAAALSRLGQPFFTTKGQRGTGLGLWVSRGILQRYGGSLRLRSSTSDKRHGTTFIVSLPLELRPRLVEASGRRSVPANEHQGTVVADEGALPVLVNQA